MSKACSNLFMPFEHNLKGPDHASKEALTYALLETVRLVLEGHKSDDEDKHAPSSPAFPEHVTSSEHTSSGDHYVDAPVAPRKVSPKVGVLGGPCAHCGAAESPQWRRPLTKKVVLCNACGIYYSRHHSLPKRKKMPGVKHSAGEDAEFKEEEISGPPLRTLTPKPPAPEVDLMAVCEAPFKPDSSANSDGFFGLGLKPLMTQRESISSAECMQLQYTLEEAKPAHTPTNSMSMACMSPTTSCGSPMHYSSGIAAPPTTPKKRTDDQIDALFDAHEESLAKRAMKRAAAAAMTAAAGHAAAAMSSAPANSTGTSSPAEMSEGFVAGGSAGSMRRPVLTASLAASMGRHMPNTMQQQPSPSPLQMPQRVSILEALMHQQTQSRMSNKPLGNTVHSFSALPGILMTSGNASFHAHPPGYSGLRPVGPTFSEQSADSDAGSIMMPASTCRGPRSKPTSRQGSPVYTKYRS